MRSTVILTAFRLATSVLIAAVLLAHHTYAQSIRVAVFDDAGVGKSAKDLLRELDTKRFDVRRIAAAEIRDGGLSEFDVLVHPGGSGSRQGKALGEEGRRAVRSFVEAGGGYLGVCAGSYLATNDYAWSLHLIDAKVLDRRHWARGTGKVQVELSARGVSFFDAPKEFDLYYGQGPLLARREWDDNEVPDYESLAIYKGEIAKNGAPQGVMAGTSAIVRTDFGSGRVFCFSPHPELTEGRGKMIGQAVDWLVRRTDTTAE